MRERLHRVGEAAAVITNDMMGLERRSWSVKKGDRVPPNS